MHTGLSGKLRDKKDKYKKMKRGLITKTEYQQIARICKDGVRKAKAQNELRFTRNAKNNPTKVSFNM